VAIAVRAGAGVVFLDIMRARKSWVLNLCSLGIPEFPFSHRFLSSGIGKLPTARPVRFGYASAGSKVEQAGEEVIYK